MRVSQVIEHWVGDVALIGTKIICGGQSLPADDAALYLRRLLD